jgi:TonB family protein
LRTLLLITLFIAAAVSTARAATQNGPGRGGNPPCHAPRPTAREDDDKVYDPRELTCRAVVISKPEPAYPARARSDGITGVVRLRAVLMASGKVGEITVVKGLPEDVSEAAIEAARRVKFTPAVKGDRWVSQRIMLEYNFNIY